MDYEKAYKAVLETATKWIEDGCTDKEIICLESVFPELRESEDERIRKAIIELLKEVGRDDTGISENAKCMIAYLEKQKEQKPAEWSKNDTVFLNEITDFFENKTVRLQHDIDMYAHWLKSLPERFNIQPKQEWGEEDEKILNEVLDSVTYAFYDQGKAGEIEDDPAFLWLHRLRPSWKPSEEQMEVDFKIEERKWVHDAVDNIFPEDGDFMSEVDFRKILKDTAHHFYELGLKAKEKNK